MNNKHRQKMSMSITLVITVVLVWMVSSTSRVTALWGILGVTARQECCFEAKFDFTIKSNF